MDNAGVLGYSFTAAAEHTTMTIWLADGLEAHRRPAVHRMESVDLDPPVECGHPAGPASVLVLNYPERSVTGYASNRGTMTPVFSAVDRFFNECDRATSHCRPTVGSPSALDLREHAPETYEAVSAPPCNEPLTATGVAGNISPMTMTVTEEQMAAHTCADCGEECATAAEASDPAAHDCPGPGNEQRGTLSPETLEAIDRAAETTASNAAAMAAARRRRTGPRSRASREAREAASREATDAIREYDERRRARTATEVREAVGFDRVHDHTVPRYLGNGDDQWACPRDDCDFVGGHEAARPSGHDCPQPF